MGFQARNVETKLIVAARREDAALKGIAAIADAESFEQVTDLPKGEDRTWQVVGADGDIWPNGCCQWGVFDDCKAVLELCEPGSAIEFFDEDEFEFVRFARTEDGVREMSSEPHAYWDAAECMQVCVDVGGGARLKATALPESGAIAVDVERADGMGGQIAYVEKTPAAMRGEYPTAFHVFGYDGNVEDPARRVDFDPDGEAVAYPAR